MPSNYAQMSETNTIWPWNYMNFATSDLGNPIKAIVPAGSDRMRKARAYYRWSRSRAFQEVRVDEAAHGKVNMDVKFKKK